MGPPGHQPIQPLASFHLEVVGLLSDQEFIVNLNGGYEITYSPTNLGVTDLEIATLTLENAERINFAGFVTEGEDPNKIFRNFGASKFDFLETFVNFNDPQILRLLKLRKVQLGI